jgi:hypothetical protein
MRSFAAVIITAIALSGVSTSPHAQQPPPRPATAAPAPPAEAQKPSPPAAKQAAAVLTVAAIAALIIEESRARYYASGHPCACPEDRTRNGRSCGNMSAYIRPGGEHPLCYPGDVTAAMIEARRQETVKK